MLAWFCCLYATNTRTRRIRHNAPWRDVSSERPLTLCCCLRLPSTKPPPSSSSFRFHFHFRFAFAYPPSQVLSKLSRSREAMVKKGDDLEEMVTHAELAENAVMLNTFRDNVRYVKDSAG